MRFKVGINFKNACDLQKVAGWLHYYKSGYFALDKIKNKLIRVFGHNVFDVINMHWSAVEKLCLALIKMYDRSGKDNPVFEIEDDGGYYILIKDLDDGTVYRVFAWQFADSKLFEPELIEDEDFITAYNSED